MIIRYKNINAHNHPKNGINNLKKQIKIDMNNISKNLAIGCIYFPVMVLSGCSYNKTALSINTNQTNVTPSSLECIYVPVMALSGCRCNKITLSADVNETNVTPGSLIQLKQSIETISAEHKQELSSGEKVVQGIENICYYSCYALGGIAGATHIGTLGGLYDWATGDRSFPNLKNGIKNGYHSYGTITGSLGKYIGRTGGNLGMLGIWSLYKATQGLSWGYNQAAKAYKNREVIIKELKRLTEASKEAYYSLLSKNNSFTNKIDSKCNHIKSTLELTVPQQTGRLH